ncbi:hypothetical protein [Citrobacter freundii]|uniref:hypothetical protein n=1 Tax=Citrobacter freundii TaxID=546 RepID=UPI001A327129|nr:hypothetical protein [Citrobacter freundii]
MKKKFFDLFSNAVPFLLLGGILGLMTPIVPKLLIPEISGILMESIAPKSIMFLLIIDALFTVILLRLCGVFDSKKEKSAFIYERFLFKFNELGKSITAATFGTLFGLTLAMLPYSEFRMAGVGLYFSAMLIVIWALFDFLSHMSKNAVGKTERCTFYTVVIAIFAYYLYLIATQIQASTPVA